MVTRKGNPRSITNHLNPLPYLPMPGAFLDAIGSSSFDRTMSLGSHLFALGIDPLTGLPHGATAIPGLCSSFASPRVMPEGNSPAPGFAAKKALPSSMDWTSTPAGPLLFNVETTPPNAPESSESGVHVRPHGHAGLTLASAEDKPPATHAFLATDTGYDRKARNALPVVPDEDTTLTSTGAVATVSAPTRLDGRTVTQFINPLPNLLTPNLFLDARGGGTFDISMREGLHDFGLGAAFAAAPAWGYHSSSASLWDDLGLNYLGPTIVAQEGVPISINWTNDLPTSHLLKVDTTLHGAHESMHGGVHVQPHVHGGLTVAGSDGNPFASDAFLGTETYD